MASPVRRHAAQHAEASPPSADIAREVLGLLSAPPRTGMVLEQRQCLLAFTSVAIAWAIVAIHRIDSEARVFQRALKRQKFGLASVLPSQVPGWLLLELGNVVFGRWHDYLIGSLGRVYQVQVTNTLHERYFSDLTFYHARGLNSTNCFALDIPAMAQGLANVFCTTLSILLRSAVVGIYLLWRAPNPWKVRTAAVSVPVVYATLGVVVFLRWAQAVAQRQWNQQSLESGHRRQYRLLQSHIEAITSLRGEQLELQQMRRQLMKVVRHGIRMLPITWLFDVASDLLRGSLQLPLEALLVLGALQTRPATATSSAAQRTNDVEEMVVWQVRNLWKLHEHQLQLLMQTRHLLSYCMRLSLSVKKVGTFALELRKRHTWQQDWDSLSWMEFGNCLAFQNATICTPSGRTLVSDLTLKVHRGEDLLICGPSGVGKTALARCLGALWPVLQGKVVRPVEGGIGGGKFWVSGRVRRRSRSSSGRLQGWVNGLAEDGAVVYLCRNPVLPLADCRDLREQIVASPSGVHVSLSAASIQAIDHLIQVAGLDHLSEGLSRDAGLESLQRLALARLLWRRPAFAILDGVTSALPPGDEEALLDACRNEGITLITVLQRPGLERHHCRMLTLQGDGHWRLDPLGAALSSGSSVSDDPEGSAGAVPTLSLPAPHIQGTRGVARQHSFGSGSLRPSVASTGDLLALRMEGQHAQAQHLTAHARLLEPIRTLLDQLQLQLRLVSCLRWVSAGDVGVVAVVLALSFCGAWAKERSAASAAAVLRLAVDPPAGGSSGGRRVVLRLLGLAVARATAGSLAVQLGAGAALACQRRLCAELLRRCLKPHRFLRLTQLLGATGGGVGPVLSEDVPALTSGTWRFFVDMLSEAADAAVLGVSLLLTLIRGKDHILDAEAFRSGTTGGLLLLTSSVLPWPEAALQLLPSLGRDQALYIGHSQIRREAEGVAFAHTQARRWVELENTWKASLAEQRLQRWQSSLVGTLRHATMKLLSLLMLWALSLLYRRSLGKTAALPFAGESMHYLWAITGPLSASIGVLMWSSRDRWCALLRPGGRVWQLIEALEAVEREEEQAARPECTPETAAIVLEDADVWTPEGTKPVAIRLTLALKPDQVGLVICGPAGVGKSTLARTLCGLLPVEVGALRLPPAGGLQLVPSTPYMPAGTLADLITYPDRLPVPFTAARLERLKSAALGAQLLSEVAEPAQLFQASDRWDETLSPQRQQCISFARLLWHAPLFAVLEAGCTASLNPKDEESLLEACDRAHITLVRVLPGRAATTGRRRGRMLLLEGGGRWKLEQPRHAGSSNHSGPVWELRNEGSPVWEPRSEACSIPEEGEHSPTRS